MSNLNFHIQEYVYMRKYSIAVALLSLLHAPGKSPFRNFGQNHKTLMVIKFSCMHVRNTLVMSITIKFIPANPSPPPCCVIHCMRVHATGYYAMHMYNHLHYKSIHYTYRATSTALCFSRMSLALREKFEARAPSTDKITASV